MKNLKLNVLASENLSKVEMNQLQGGVDCCICGCAYANSGGSSTNDNGSANRKSDKYSTEGDLTYNCA
jgi:natural product precursor